MGQFRDYPYKVFKNGKIKRNGKAIGVFPTDEGYLKVSLYNNGTQKSFLLSRIIAEVFIPNPNNLPEINHKKGIKADNRASQLEWCTRKQNMEHAKKFGLLNAPKGIDSGMSKLINKEVIAIYNSTLPDSELALKYKVGKSIIGYIKCGKSWSHITGKKYKKLKRRMLKKSEILEIFYSDLYQTKIAAAHNITQAMVSRIKRKVVHRHITSNL